MSIDKMDDADLPEHVRDYKLATRFLQDRRIVHLELQEYWERDKQPIGRGGQGRVFVQSCTEGPRRGSQRAVKIIPHQHGGARRRYLSELQTIIKFSHDRYSRHFVKTLGWYESKNHLYIAMEYFPAGDLQTYLHKNSLPEDDARQITIQVLQGLATMHKEDFAHRDIKPQNVLIHQHPTPANSGTWIVKLADFGISKRLEAVTQGASTVVGTEDYMAPELFASSRNHKIDHAAADMWSLGVMAFFILTGRCAFRNQRDMFHYEKSPDECFPRADLENCQVSEDGQAFVRGLMRPDPRDRPDFNAAGRLDWVSPWMPSELIISDTHSQSSASSPYSQRSSFDERGMTTQVSQISDPQTAVKMTPGFEVPAPVTPKDPGSLVWADGWETAMGLIGREGASFGQATEDEKTPPTHTIPGVRKDVVKLPLEKGADVKVPNRTTDHPVSLAEDTGHGTTKHSSMKERVGFETVESQPRPPQTSVPVDAGSYRTPIGVFKFQIKQTKGLCNNLFKPHQKGVYTRVLCSGIEIARTSTCREGTDPTWDEFLYVPFHSSRDQLVLDVTRSDEIAGDSSIGRVELLADELVGETNGKYLEYHSSSAKKFHVGRLRGCALTALIYTATFHWCPKMVDPEDEEDRRDDDSMSAGQVQLNYNSFGEAAMLQKAGQPFLAKQPVLRLSPAELLQHESGLLIFHLSSKLQGPKTQLEVFFDDYMYPARTSSNTTHKFVIGNFFIRELNFSRITVKARGEKDGPDQALTQVTASTIDLLKRCLNIPTTSMLRDKTNPAKSMPIDLRLTYVPIKMDLDPRERIANTGKLRIDIIGGEMITSSGRNLDPYCQIVLNDVQVYTTKKSNKSQHPKWNETVEVEIPSRIDADMVFKVYDHTFFAKHELLGTARADLGLLEPHKSSRLDLYINPNSPGTVGVRLLFRPGWVKQSRQEAPAPTAPGTLKSLREALKMA